MNKTEVVRKRLYAGLEINPKQLTEELECSRALVHLVIAEERKKGNEFTVRMDPHGHRWYRIKRVPAKAPAAAKTPAAAPEVAQPPAEEEKALAARRKVRKAVTRRGRGGGRRQTRERILKFLQDGEPHTYTEISTAVGCHGGTPGRIIQLLEQEGHRFTQERIDGNRGKRVRLVGNGDVSPKIHASKKALLETVEIGEKPLSYPALDTILRVNLVTRDAEGNVRVGLQNGLVTYLATIIAVSG